MRALADEVSGENAFAYTARISQFDRIQASDGWHDSAVWIKSELDKMGYTDATIEGWPSNGSSRYFTWKTPVGWRARHAELWLVSPRREKLASFTDLPLVLIKHSGPAHLEAELVNVGTGVGDASYRGKDVTGKIVLATGAPGAVAAEAVVKRGAVGMVGWYPPDVRPGYPNMVRYTAFWPRWEERGKLGFGFNVSKNQGAILQQMLDAGERVVLRADVDAEFHETKVEALSVSLPGSEEPEKELLIVGHLCHPTPSANDNGSGSGGMLEMARALKQLVSSGAIPAPKRTIRFLWIPEFSGTVPYIKAHLARTRHTLAVINCDMIGEDLAKTGGLFTITQTPESLPTYLNDFAVHMASVVEGLALTSQRGTDNPFAWRAAPYSGGSDHLIFNDGSLRVPALMFGHGDRFHHTSLDTMDKVDASELRRVSVVTLGTMLYLASAGDAEARALAQLTARNGAGRLAATYHNHLGALEAADSGERWTDASRLVESAITHGHWREREAVLSALTYAKSPAAAADVKARAATIDALEAVYRADAKRLTGEAALRLKLKPVLPAVSESDARLSAVVPVRSPDFVCPLDGSYIQEVLGPDAMAGLSLKGDQPYEILNFVDGVRSVTDIARSVTVELGRVDAEQVHRYLQVLERAGLVRFKVSGRAGL
jgi:aminopeptidase-like protein